ncbi:MBL fold metallo-hydrolase [Bacillus taeanensis]|uniref:MBL fold metallo-hydrolase n=1 Tax=Bacillus taeanensis TaxID=273032 RepID=A0A366Y2Z0_9BACI|nr:MBL fold metallo-hydrolase [Bacillus taeanensis]RBW70571.1 MBL fold metallo-hydrolase [Bacillus taeanensis]
MKWLQCPVGPLQENAYILSNKEKESLIVDPGSEGKRLIHIIEEHSLKPLAILLTHAHFDHIGAVDELRDHFSIPVYVHTNEQDWLSDSTKNGSLLFPIGKEVTARDADHLIKEEGCLTLGGFSFSVFETPGHSPGSVSFYNKEAGIVFSGDALFQGSIGRTDLPGGNHQQLLESIHKKLLELPEGTVVAPGHGPETTIGQEMDTNPFLSGF